MTRISAYLAAAVLAAAFSGQAHALSARMHCQNGYRSVDCSLSTGESSGSGKLAAPTPEQIAEEHKWENFCKPQPHIDEYGVTRYTYAQKGCEFGRSQ